MYDYNFMTQYVDQFYTTLMIPTIISSVIAYLLQVLAYWNIFKKAGEKSWKSIIPIYNSYIAYKISWKPSMFALYFITAIIASILVGVAYGLLPVTSYVVFTVLAIIALVIAIISGIISIIQLYKLSKSFGHGGGYTVGLLFLNLIFLLIIGLGSSQYIGPEGKNAVSE